MLAPYGDNLVDRILPDEIFEERFSNSFQKGIILSDDDLIHLSNLVTGCYSPLTGFMTEEEYRSVLTHAKLPLGLDWTLPIILHVPERFKEDAILDQPIALKDQNHHVIGIIKVKSIFPIDFDEHGEKIFDTLDEAHPGVRHFRNKTQQCIGGEVFMVESALPMLRHFNTPKQNRKWLEENGFRTITAFSTRNICHIGHEHLHGIALELTDALGINVITGALVKGSFRSDVIFDTYEYLMENIYPSNRVFLNNMRIPPIYAGPKEAFLQAVMLQNLGFTHFIVGRDHAGVGNYYTRYSSQKIFEKLTDLDVKILAISEPRYCFVCGKVTTENTCRHSGKDVRKLNGIDVRRCLRKKQYDELSNFLRKDIQSILNEMFDQKEDISRIIKC